MKLCLVLGVLCVSITLCRSHFQSSEESSEEEEFGHAFGRGHGHHHHHHHHHDHDKCEGLEDVDLSDLSLEVEEVRKITKDQSSKENEIDSTHEVSSADDDLKDITNVKTAVKETGMGVIRKVVILPSKKKIYAKIQKTTTASGDFTTSVSGSMNTSLNSLTGGKASFEAGIQIIAAQIIPDVSLSGEVNVNANSTTKWKKVGRKNILETDSTADSETKMSTSNDPNADITAKSSSSSIAGTIIMSKKCFATGVVMKFNTSASGDGWSSTMVGKGKGGVYSRVLYATANGTSISYTFSKVSIKAHLDIKGGNWSLTGSQYITVKSLTESITRPVNASASSENLEVDLELDQEIKIRIGVSTLLGSSLDEENKKKTKIFSTGGQILFRNSKMAIKLPKTGTENVQQTEFEGENEDETEGASLLMKSNIRKQIHEDIIANPTFLNSVIASAMN